MTIPDFNMQAFFLISVAGGYIFYLLLRKPIKNKYNIDLPIVPTRYPDNLVRNFLQPIIWVIGVLIVSVLQVIVLVGLGRYSI